MKNSKSYSRIIAGTMTWGSWGKQLSKKEMLELMHHCPELGITTFDHADIYGAYGNEEEFGTTNKDRLKDAMSATKRDLELEDWFTLLTASQGHKIP